MPTKELLDARAKVQMYLNAFRYNARAVPLFDEKQAMQALVDAINPTHIDDPRPDDVAELARLTAVELRKRGIWAGAAEGTKGVVVLGNPADWTPWRNGYYYDMACKAEWSSLGPVRLADAIASSEAVRAQEWAGDK